MWFTYIIKTQQYSQQMLNIYTHKICFSQWNIYHCLKLPVCGDNKKQNNFLISIIIVRNYLQKCTPYCLYPGRLFLPSTRGTYKLFEIA